MIDNISLTSEYSCKAVSVKIKDIQAIKEGQYEEDGRVYPYTDIIFGEVEDERGIRVTESAKEIGRKIIEALRRNGEDIQVIEKRGKLERSTN